jgi:hypothetical protein
MNYKSACQFNICRVGIACDYLYIIDCLWAFGWQCSPYSFFGAKVGDRIKKAACL